MFKSVAIALVDSLYISKATPERNLSAIVNNLVPKISQDTESFLKSLKNKKFGDSAFFQMELLSFRKVYLEDSLYKPYLDLMVESEEVAMKEYSTLI